MVKDERDQRTGVGIDLGGTYIKGAVTDAQGRILVQESVPTDAPAGPDAVIGRLAELAVRLCEMAEADIDRIGVTIPGVLDPATGAVERMPNLPGPWEGVQLNHRLAPNVGREVCVLNDARAATLCEKRFGAGKPYADFICLILGTGIGGGIIHQGTLFPGSRGVAGELGHLCVDPRGRRCGCGQVGCLETAASGPAIVSAAIGLLEQERPTLIEKLCDGDPSAVTSCLVQEAAARRDDGAIGILRQAAQAIALAVRNLQAALNPEAVILGGGVADSEILLKLVERELHKPSLFPDRLGGVVVHKAHYGPLAGAVGAAAWAMEDCAHRSA